jgi:flagellar assembly factor FliW
MTAPDAVIEFADGLPGFENYRRFVLLSGAGLEPFTIVQGLGPNAPAFAAIDPRTIDSRFRAELPAADAGRLGLEAPTPLLWLAIVSAPAGAKATVNLRAPLVINPRTLRGVQLIHGESDYSVEHPLAVA